MYSELKDGIDLYNKKDYQEALVFFLSVSTEDSLIKIEINYYIGLIYSRLSEYEQALEYLEQVVTSSKDIAKVYQCRLILAFIYANTGRTRLAEFELSKLLEAGYESVQVFSSLAYVYYEHKETEKAIDYYEKALKASPENSTALNGLAYILAETGKDLTRSLLLCKKAVEKQPENPAYLDSMALIYHKMDLSAEAEDYISRAKEKLPDNKIILKHFELITSDKREA
ncbi:MULTISPECIES: lipopolysaccharide assembly protein LapB [unclassified Treponema]|uniref:tetratricopeptide repeat protein n=1 Tax=unclassified Treponema TaxID=2638727 RepID=UPI0020A260AC|nr:MULTISPECIES: tetratricopeptide repeat protein [unclassified Treponema]UTC66074.1 tetratricopeptide repeat protein [Treponema sp. OMZ 789]UTC68804.1 tetratricopeptide repeat protein [Treponema sp. OMZ 790]UTC71532.1 tetratricopeptide repeat protein [Treponema sp. OMZ 791]